MLRQDADDEGSDDGDEAEDEEDADNDEEDGEEEEEEEKPPTKRKVRSRQHAQLLRVHCILQVRFLAVLRLINHSSDNFLACADQRQ